MDNLTFSQEDYLLEEAREKAMEKSNFVLEDQSCQLDWIENAFNKAYALGYKHGLDKGRNETWAEVIKLLRERNGNLQSKEIK